MLRPLIAAFVLAGPAQAQTTPAEAFQGLPWGASEAQIGERFGAELKPARCTASMLTQAVARREVCDHPTVPIYEVAGVPFRLNLVLDTERRQLVRVSLWYAGEAENPPPNLAQDNRWSERHRMLRGLITQRYGPSESANATNEPGSFVASARWRVAGTLIELNSMFFHRLANGPAREQYEITYQPVTSGEAGKL